jgi:hypothetical protein
MSSNLRVNSIRPSSGNNVAIGTAGGTISLVTNVSGISTFSDGINVGSAFIRPNAVGLGATTTTGRNAGVGTATGTIIYNSTTGDLQFYDGIIWRPIRSGGVSATGGTITQVDGKVIHTFTGSGTFTVTSPSLSSVDYLVVAGGGGGGRFASGGGSGGGGAGGFRTGTGLPVSSFPGVYTVTVGGGGNAAPGTNRGSVGSDSVFSSISSTGGGGGGSRSAPVENGGNGGSGIVIISYST